MEPISSSTPSSTSEQSTTDSPSGVPSTTSEVSTTLDPICGTTTTSAPETCAPVTTPAPTPIVIGGNTTTRDNCVGPTILQNFGSYVVVVDISCGIQIASHNIGSGAYYGDDVQVVIVGDTIIKVYFDINLGVSIVTKIYIGGSGATNVTESIVGYYPGNIIQYFTNINSTTQYVFVQNNGSVSLNVIYNNIITQLTIFDTYIFNPVTFNYYYDSITHIDVFVGIVVDKSNPSVTNIIRVINGTVTIIAELNIPTLCACRSNHSRTISVFNNVTMSWEIMVVIADEFDTLLIYTLDEATGTYVLTRNATVPNAAAVINNMVEIDGSYVFTGVGSSVIIPKITNGNATINVIVKTTIINKISFYAYNSITHTWVTLLFIASDSGSDLLIYFVDPITTYPVFQRAITGVDALTLIGTAVVSVDKMVLTNNNNVTIVIPKSFAGINSIVATFGIAFSTSQPLVIYDTDGSSYQIYLVVSITNHLEIYTVNPITGEIILQRTIIDIDARVLVSSMIELYDRFVCTSPNGTLIIPKSIPFGYFSSILFTVSFSFNDAHPVSVYNVMSDSWVSLVYVYVAGVSNNLEIYRIGRGNVPVLLSAHYCIDAVILPTARASFVFNNVTGAWDTYLFAIRVGTNDSVVYRIDTATGRPILVSIDLEIIRIDHTTPITTCVLYPEPNENQWHNGTVTISLNATDSLSGVAGTWYSINSRVYVRYTASFIIEIDGVYNINYYSIDVAGNIESNQTVIVRIDTRRPLILGSRDLLPNVVGWANRFVTVFFQCDDGPYGSGYPACASPIIMHEGAHQVAVGSVTDLAGNVGSVEIVDINIDITSPVTVLTRNVLPNIYGWNNINIDLFFAPADILSGIHSFIYWIGNGPKTSVLAVDIHQHITTSINIEGIYPVTYYAIDIAENIEIHNNIIVRIDKTIPVINYVCDRQPNVHGWYNTDISLTYTCSDALSGVANGSCPGVFIVDVEAANQIITKSVSDCAGNNASISTSVINIDKTLPTIEFDYSVQVNSYGWYNQIVTIGFHCHDLLSGVRVCPTAIVFDHEGAHQPCSGTAIDYADNSNSISVDINIDLTAPTIVYVLSFQPNSYGWCNVDVSIEFTCTDVLSGIAGECPSLVLIDYEIKEYVITRGISDKAGNNASVSTTAISIDKTKPVLVFDIDRTVNEYGWYNQIVTVGCNCTDNLSGVRVCPPSQVFYYEGAHQSCSGTVIDYADNEDTVSIDINIDLTAPTFTYELSFQPNVYGWCNAAVSVLFRCFDALSGIPEGSCPPLVLIDYEIEKQVITRSINDKAGNQATIITREISIDLIKPTIEFVFSSQPNSYGWYNQYVSVSCVCRDNLSGVRVCPGTREFKEGNGQKCTGTVIDYADNNDTISVDLNIDVTAPTIITTVYPQPNAQGWCNKDVTISYVCSDNLSGLNGPCPSTVVIDQDCKGKHYDVVISDLAGNTASSNTTINLDKTAPTIVAIVTPVPNANGWNNKATNVTFICSDALSGIKSCPPSVIVNEGKGQVISGTCYDNAGNSASTSVTVNVDLTPPKITGSTNSGGWCTKNTDVTFTCSDSLSGIKSCPGTVQLEDGYNQVITGTATDNAGNTASTTVRGVNVDKTPPVLNVNYPNGTTFSVCEICDYSSSRYRTFDCNRDCEFTPTFNPTDRLSGIATKSSRLQRPTTNSGVGVYKFFVSATDRAGNSISEVYTYYVRYEEAFSGFITPSANDNIRLSNSITFKFSMRCSRGRNQGTNYIDDVNARLMAVETSKFDPSVIPTMTLRDPRFTAYSSFYQYSLSTRNTFTNPDGKRVTFTKGKWTFVAIFDDNTYETVAVNLV
jgi:hypothetical protein